MEQIRKPTASEFDCLRKDFERFKARVKADNAWNKLHPPRKVPCPVCGPGQIGVNEHAQLACGFCGRRFELVEV